MKRFISIVVMVIMLVSTLPVYSLAKVNDDELGHVFWFEEYQSDLKTTISHWGLGDTDLLIYEEPSETGNSLDLKCFYGTKTACFNKRDAASMRAWTYVPEITNTHADVSPDQIAFQFNLRNEGEAVKTFDVYSKNYQESTQCRVNLFTIDETGYININNEPVVYIPKRQFTEVTLIMDCENWTKTLYVNGEKIVVKPYNEKIHLANSELVRPYYGVIFDLTVSGGQGKLYLSYCSVYEAKKYFNKEQIIEKYDQLQTRISAKPSKNELRDFLQGYTAFAVEAKYAFHHGERYEIPNIVYNDLFGNKPSTMVPVRYVAEAMDGEVLWSEEQTTVKINGKTIVIKEGSDILTVDGAEKQMPYAAHVKNGALYVPYEHFMNEFGEVYFDGDTIVIGEKFADKFTEYWTAEEVFLYLHFYRPDPEEILEAYNNSSVKGQHPRLDWTKDLVADRKKVMQSDATLKAWIDERISAADGKLKDEPYLPYFIDNYSLSTTIPTAETLAFAYMITGKEKYAEAAWKHLELFCNYPGLQYTRNYMSNAIIVTQAATAFDQLGDWPTKEMRDKMWHAVKRMSLDAHVKAGLGVAGFCQTNMNYIYQNHNVFHNGNILALCLTFFEYDPEFCAKAIAQAFRNYEYFRTIRKPDGGDPEGPHYWDYGIGREVEFFERAFNVLGTDFGYCDTFGMPVTAEHYVHCIAPSGQLYSYADCKPSEMLSVYGYWFAKRYKNPTIANEIMYHIDRVTREADYVDLIRWYDPELHKDTTAQPLPLDGYYRNTEMGAMRTRWGDDSASYLGYKGSAFVVQAHQHFDVGSFVYDALGERWAMDLGFENQAYPYLYEINYDGPLGKERYYMIRGEGHNTLLVNPRGRRYDQPIDPQVRRVEYDSKEGGAYSVFDTTNLYFGEATDAKRGFLLTDYRQTAVIRDEMTLTQDSNDIYWFMHTEAKIEILEGGKQALLTRNGKQVIASLECSNPSAKFSVMDAVAFEESPKPSAPQYVTNLSHVKKLTVNLKQGSGKFNIAVTLKPVKTTLSEELASLKSYGSIDKWKVSSEAPFECEGLEELLVNGEPIKDFNSDKAVYTLQYESANDPIPVISAKAKGDYNIEIIQATSLPGAAAVKIYDEENPDNYYSVQIACAVPELWEGFPEGVTELEPVGIVASQEPNGTVATNLIDDIHTTILAVQGPADVILDLGEAKEFDGVGVKFTYARRCWFSVEVSNDKNNWTTLFDGETMGVSDYDAVIKNGTKARFVKFNFNGTSEGAWNSISEVRVIKK